MYIICTRFTYMSGPFSFTREFYPKSNFRPMDNNSNIIRNGLGSYKTGKTKKQCEHKA